MARHVGSEGAISRGVLVAIDPGYAKRGQGCAVALFDGGALVGAFFARPETITPDALTTCAREVVWEKPQLDERTRTSAPAVVELAAVGGTLAGMFAGAAGCRAHAVTPSAWKGSVAKPVAHGRLWETLSFAERAILGGDATAARIEAAKRAGGLDRWGKPGAAYYGAWAGHNLLDAVGIGVWRLGRIQP